MSETNVSVPSHLKVLSFMKYRKVAMIVSAALLIIAIVSSAVKSLNFGLDFTGGTQVELEFQKPADLEDIRQKLAAGGFPGAVVAHFGVETEVLIRLRDGTSSKPAGQAEKTNAEKAADDLNLGNQIIDLLSQDGESIELKRLEFVGPQVGEELRDQGGLGMLVALLIVMGYVAFRFQYKFSVGAVAALAHDVIVVLGMFSLLGLEFDLTVLAAILAVIGYSLNDTIVVSDRIRENFRKVRQSESVEIIDISLSETLGRTLVTSLTTLLVLLALFFVGGELIHGFAIALIIGVIIGTYSSIYVAANILLAMNISTQDLIEPVKEGAELDELP